MHAALLLLLAAWSGGAAAQGYEVPDATLIAFSPRGLQVSIPDSEGVQLFAFHGNINKEMGDREAGQLAKDVLRPKNGRWVFEDTRIRLKVGDVINYWLYVQVDNLGYPKDFLSWTVPTLMDRNAVVNSTTAKPTVSPTCPDSVTMVNGQKSCKGQLIFEETFDSLSESKWEHISQFGSEPSFPFVIYMRNNSQSFTTDGNLHITPTLLPEESIISGTIEIPNCTGVSNECISKAGGGVYNPPVYSAQIRTRNSFNFRYGRVEIRAKLPLGDWIYPEIQLKPTNSIYGSSPRLASGQINIALARGNRDLKVNGQDVGAKVLESHCDMGYQRETIREVVRRTGESSWGDSYHNYGLIWSPDELVFTVDGNVVGTIAPPVGGFQSKPQFSKFLDIPWRKGSKLAPFDQEFYISLGVGVGGFCEFPENSLTINNHPKPWRNWEAKAIAKFWNDRDNWFSTWRPHNGPAHDRLQVDYVKVWAL